MVDMAPFAWPPILRTEERYRRFFKALDVFAKALAKLVAVIVLGTACTVGGMAFLLSLGIAMPIVSEQFATWLKNGQWNAAPLGMVLTKIGYVPWFDGSLSRMVIDRLLSHETGLAIVVAATAFGCAVWIFETTRSRLFATNPIAPWNAGRGS